MQKAISDVKDTKISISKAALTNKVSVSTLRTRLKKLGITPAPIARKGDPAANNAKIAEKMGPPPVTSKSEPISKQLAEKQPSIGPNADAVSANEVVRESNVDLDATLDIVNNDDFKKPDTEYETNATASSDSDNGESGSPATTASTAASETAEENESSPSMDETEAKPNTPEKSKESEAENKSLLKICVELEKGDEVGVEEDAAPVIPVPAVPEIIDEPVDTVEKVSEELNENPNLASP